MASICHKKTLLFIANGLHKLNYKKKEITKTNLYFSSTWQFTYHNCCHTIRDQTCLLNLTRLNRNKIKKKRIKLNKISKYRNPIFCLLCVQLIDNCYKSIKQNSFLFNFKPKYFLSFFFNSNSKYWETSGVETHGFVLVKTRQISCSLGS